MSRYFSFPQWNDAVAGKFPLRPSRGRPTCLRLGLALASGLLALEFAASSAGAALPGRTVVLGPLEWAAQNLDVGTFNNGDPIPEARTPADWVQATRDGTPAWAWYDGDPKHGARDGRLYNLAAVQDPRGLAPPGWRVATSQDFAELIRSVGPEAAPKLKSTSGWKDGGHGTNASGFNALPAGSRYGNGRSYGMGEYAVFGAADGARFFLTALGAFRGSGNFGRDGLALRLVREAPKGLTIVPAHPPNPGLLFVDHEATGRSGHTSFALTECRNGDILAFYANTSGVIHGGHTGAGWSEYKRSTDGGRTWGPPVVFDYSKRVWDANRHVDGATYRSTHVRALRTAPDGTLVALAMTYWFDRPALYFLSHDHGHTWSEPRELDSTATGDEAALVYGGALFVHEDAVYFASSARYSGAINLYVSRNNGNSFEKLSEHLFAGRLHRGIGPYVTAGVLDDGRFIVYTYDGPDDEHNFPYVISEDRGRTWSEVRYTYMEKKIRCPQLSEKIGDYYFMHARTGNRGFDSGNFVLYTSRDGIRWDSGRYLNRGEGVAFPGSDAYSGNTVVGQYDPTTRKRLLIQASISYDASRTNVKHWWIENIPGTEERK